MTTPPGFFITYKENDVERMVRLYATTSDWNQDIHISDDRKSITMVGNQQMRFTTLDNAHYIYHSLLNKTISFTMDLSHVRKNWNVAFYTIDASGMHPPMYADAQSWPSVAEVDIMEANRVSWHTTHHKPYDRGGNCCIGFGGTINQYMPQNRFQCDHCTDRARLYHPGSEHIDTNKPFRASITYYEDHQRLELEQDGRKIYKEDWTGYNKEMAEILKEPKHTFVMSLWTGAMGWLDGDTAWFDESHIHQEKATISDIRITDI